MRPQGKVFDGSSSLFESQRLLKNTIGNAICLTQFTPANLDHLIFVRLLLETFCTLGICCALAGLYPAYIAGMLSSFYKERFCICHLYVAKYSSAILDPLFRKTRTFKIEPFGFRLIYEREYENFQDYSTYEITHGDVSLDFRIVIEPYSSHPHVCWATRNKKNKTVGTIQNLIICAECQHQIRSI